MTHVRMWALSALCLTAPLAVYASAEPATPPAQPSLVAPSPVTEKQASMLRHVLDTWMNTVATHKVEDILPLYADNAVLLPTVAPRVHEMPEERKEYFEHFAAKPDLKGVVDEVHFRMLGDNAAVASGLYTFSFTKDGQTLNVPARFTFVYEKQGDAWKIVEHHSSKTPE